MWICYLLCAIPLVGGMWAWAYSKRIVWWEWLLSFGLAVLACVIWHLCLVWGMTVDEETWSGYVKEAIHYPEWVEKYRVSIYKTVTRTSLGADGKMHTSTKRVFSHYETRYRTYREHWEAYDTLGQGFGLDRGRFEQVAKEFGGTETRDGNKSGFYSGDRNIYVSLNRTGVIFPTTTTKSWTNKVKSAPSLFSYAKIPPDVKVFEYPYCNGWCDSPRLLGGAGRKMPILEWDRLNARLGSMKKVNLIACGFPSEGDGDSCMAQYQESAWLGGKKNDVVICFGGDPERPSWVNVFGWTEREICKRNLESLVLKEGLVLATLPKIEKELIANYEIKDWSKFDYLEVEPPTGAYITILLVIVFTQAGVWWFCATNKESEDVTLYERLIKRDGKRP